MYLLHGATSHLGFATDGKSIVPPSDLLFSSRVCIFYESPKVQKSILFPSRIHFLYNKSFLYMSLHLFSPTTLPFLSFSPLSFYFEPTTAFDNLSLPIICLFLRYVLFHRLVRELLNDCIFRLARSTHPIVRLACLTCSFNLLDDCLFRLVRTSQLFLRSHHEQLLSSKPE